MATREESLKKINAELEKLSDDELEQVAGGFYARSNVGDVKPDANIENKNKIIGLRRDHWTAQAKLGY